MPEINLLDFIGDNLMSGHFTVSTKGIENPNKYIEAIKKRLERHGYDIISNEMGENCFTILYKNPKESFE